MEKDIYIGETCEYALYAHIKAWVEPADYDREFGRYVSDETMDYEIEHIVSKHKDGSVKINELNEFPDHLVSEFHLTVANNPPTIDEIKRDF